jgi:hypothetical protein
MISKGTAHNNGAKLARYMVTGKEGERAELWKLFGFASDNIADAFRDVQIMAAGTKCQQPFFHVQVRTPEGEELTRDQWGHVAKRIQSILGLNGQPGAISFHIDEATGHEHMHLAISRIDQDTLTARALPFFKRRLKEVSRELEKELGLTIVTNERIGPIKYAPTRAEEEQARRLGVDIREIRQTIRNCYDRSDCGRSFEAALAPEGLILTQGDRRDFMVIDAEGGMHALGKRILGVTATQIRNRLSDLDRDQLPGVEQARSHVAEREIARQREKREKMADPDREEMRWQNSLARAAIRKEKVERQFVEPRERKGEARNRPEPGSRGEKRWPITPPMAEPIRTYARYHFEGAAHDTTRPQPEQAMPEKLRGAAAHIWTAWRQSDSAKAFAAALDEKGIVLAAVTKEEAARSHMDAEFAKAVSNRATRYREGEIVAVSPSFRLYKLNERTTGEGRAGVEKFLRLLDRSPLQGIEATKQMMHDRAEQRQAAAQLFSLLDPVKQAKPRAIDTRPTGRPGQATGKNENLKIPPRALGNAAVGAVGKVLDVAARALESLFAPTLTPGQVREGQKAVNRREVEAEHRIDFSSYTAEMAQQRQREEQDRETTRQRERERGGRER